MTTRDERQTAALLEAVTWLEEALRDNRAETARLSQALDEAHNLIWELTNRMLRTEDTVAAVLPQLPVIPQIDARAAQLKEVLRAVQEHGEVNAARHADLQRQVDAATERDRLVVNEISHRLDTLERQASTADARLDALDESVRRSMEAVTLVRQRVEEVARSIDGFDAHIARVADSATRTEHELAGLAGHLDDLAKRDDVLADRIALFHEITKRLDGQIALVSDEVAFKHDVVERIELARVETHRLEERVSGIEVAAEAIREQTGEVERALSLLDGRQKGLQERISTQIADSAEHRALVNDQFQRLHQLLERLKRRQIEDIERDLREMRIHAFRQAEQQ